MSNSRFLLRRSLRLQLNGYYTYDGIPTISYKETRVRRRRHQRHLNTRTTAVPKEDSFDDSGTEYQKNYSLNTFCWISIFSLFFGCAYLFSALSSQPSETLVTPTETDMVSTPGCKDLKELLANQHEQLLSIKKELDYLLPPADLLPNFALESQGARILHHMTSDTYQSRARCSLCGFALQQPAVGPTIVIQGKTHLLPGQCWAFAGSQGRLSIALPYKVSISHVTLAHIPKMVSPTGTILSAPKEFSVYGKNDLEDEGSLLGTFLYDEDGDRLQSFKIPDHKTGAFTYITLQVKSNWGQSEYTCLYGFRVHGKLEE